MVARDASQGMGKDGDAALLQLIIDVGIVNDLAEQEHALSGILLAVVQRQANGADDAVAEAIVAGNVHG